MPKKDVLITPTMTQEIRDCISEQPSKFIIEDGHPDIKGCENLIRLLKNGSVNACLPGWSRLKPLVHDDTIEFRTANVREKKPVGFNREILMFGYPEEVVIMAITIHDYFNRIIRKKDNRRNLFFQVIYYAHLILKIVVYPESIAYRVGIHPNKISQSFDINPVHFCISLPDPVYQPFDYLPQILDEHNLAINLAKIVNIPIVNLVANHPLITNKYRPQRIAYVAVILFINANGINLQEGVYCPLADLEKVKTRQLLDLMINYDC